MFWYQKIDRLTLALALLWSGYFLVVGRYETAIAVPCVWIFTRAAISILDVFHTFIAERPLVTSIGTGQTVLMRENELDLIEVMTDFETHSVRLSTLPIPRILVV